MAAHHAPEVPVTFETHPSRYKHVRLHIDGPIAHVRLDIQEEEGLRRDYTLKLNSYDLGVDIELADAVQRLRFEHPEVSCVVLGSAVDGVFCAGANIFMLGSSAHAFKVNFCKYTNETRLYIEDASAHSGQRWIAALNGVASGGGYELPLACEEIYLVDDRRSAVALPEVPFLGVLPGTGGLTRVVDKRKVRRDRADVFSTLAEGIKGRRAKDWNLVDGVFPPSKFEASVAARAAEIAGAGRPERRGIELPPLAPSVSAQTIEYKYVTVRFGPGTRTATLTVRGPEAVPALPADVRDLGPEFWSLRAFRELDDAILRLRFNHRDVALVVLRAEGDADTLIELDEALLARQDDWYVREVLLHQKRVLKRVDVTSKTFFALADRGTAFAGVLAELLWAADRAYALDDDGVAIALSPISFGTLPMGNGLTRLQTRFLADTKQVDAAERRVSERLTAQDALGLGLVTEAWDPIDWDDEIRLAREERAGLSPDALTGMEANLRFAGPETLETKIFGRLSAWQNWIFQRPNAVGPKGALTLYGQPQTAEYDFERT